MTPTFWQTVTGVLTAVGAALSIYYGGRALKAKTEADRGARELDGVKVSVDSLKVALAQSNADNEKLRVALGETNVLLERERSSRLALGEKLDELTEEFRHSKRDCNERVAILAAQIVSLGGTPDPGAVAP